MEQLPESTVESAGSGSLVAVAAVVIWAMVAVLKSPAFPLEIPPRIRPWLALALGQIYAVLSAVVGGVPWGVALTEGLVATTLAVTGQELGGTVRRRGAP